MKKDRICKHCKTIFNMIEGRVFSNHVRWCSFNPSKPFSDKGLSQIKKSNNERLLFKFGKIKTFKVKCSKCKTTITIQEREKLFPKKEKYYCSRSCANSRGPRSKDVKKKVREKLQIYKNKNCKLCLKVFKQRKKTHKFCSISCAQKYRYKDNDKSTLSYYRNMCAFDFSIKKYPKEFNLDLIKKFGWYSASNRKNNLTGVSRDHLVSIRYGFDNNIDPEIMKHPANCQLIQQGKNAAKGTKCQITVDELIKRIEIWNDKYNIKNKE